MTFWYDYSLIGYNLEEEESQYDQSEEGIPCVSNSSSLSIGSDRRVSRGKGGEGEGEERSGKPRARMTGTCLYNSYVAFSLSFARIYRKWGSDKDCPSQCKSRAARKRLARSQAEVNGIRRGAKRENGPSAAYQTVDDAGNVSTTAIGRQRPVDIRRNCAGDHVSSDLVTQIFHCNYTEAGKVTKKHRNEQNKDASRAHASRTEAHNATIFKGLRTMQASQRTSVISHPAISAFSGSQ